MVGKQTVVYLYNKILLGNKKKEMIHVIMYMKLKILC